MGSRGRVEPVVGGLRRPRKARWLLRGLGDPNDWSIEIGGQSYILDLVRRVTTVSIRTVDIVKSLPELPI